MRGLIVLFAVAVGVVVSAATGVLVWRLRRPPRKTLGVAMARGDATDPADLGLEAEEVTFSLSDGSATPGWMIRGGRGDGPTLVMAHGFSDSRFGSLMRCPAVVEHVAAIVVFDQRGQGDSEASSSCGGGREWADLLNIIEQLPERPPVVLHGQSMGACGAIAAAAQLPGERVAGVIAEAPYRTWDQPVRAIFRERRYPTWPMIPLAGLVMRLLGCGFPPPDVVEQARQLRCPLLVILAKDDSLVDVATGEAIAEAAPQGELVLFETGGHDWVAAGDPERYRATLGGFLRRVAAPKPATGVAHEPS